MDLTDAQIERYSRQIILPALGGRGQQRLLDSTVHVVGTGPLATIAAWYLTAAGIGTLDLWTDREDAVDRQPLCQDLAALNSDTTVRLHSLHSPAAEHGDVSTASVVVCADVTAAVLAQVNDIAVRQRLPLLAGRAGAQPHLATYAGHDTDHPCAACDPQPPVRERQTTAPDPTSTLIGSLLALEAIKASLGQTGFRPGTGLHYDPETLTISEAPIQKRAHCRACTPARGSET